MVVSGIWDLGGIVLMGRDTFPTSTSASRSILIICSALKRFFPIKNYPLSSNLLSQY